MSDNRNVGAWKIPPEKNRRRRKASSINPGRRSSTSDFLSSNLSFKQLRESGRRAPVLLKISHLVRDESRLRCCRFERQQEIFLLVQQYLRISTEPLPSRIPAGHFVDRVRIFEQFVVN
jgi:hypothetical protein